MNPNMANYTPAASGISVDDIFDKLGARTQEMERQLDDATKNMKSDDPKSMLEFQRIMSKWGVATELQTSTIKAVRDVLRSVIQKV